MPIIRIILITACLFTASPAKALDLNLDTEEWAQSKSTHFIIYYQKEDLGQTVSEILRKAEDDYERILDRIGAKKVDNFWTWEDRVKIIYFASHEDFIKGTNQPAWSKGISLTHMSNFQMRVIVSYQGQDDFIDNVLPHEISHLVLHDFMRKPNVPRWFDEGMAQLDEINNNDEHRQILARLIEANKGIPFAMLEAFPSMINQDPVKAGIFYAESLYIVDFLIKTYGKDNFATLCRQMRDGLTFEGALVKVYYPTIESVQTLEDKWNQYMLSLVHIQGGL